VLPVIAKSIDSVTMAIAATTTTRSIVVVCDPLGIVRLDYF
jgi:hypothetical protein